MLVKAIMSTPVLTTEQTTQVGLALELMKSNHVRHLPVVTSTGTLVGLVSESDLLKIYPRKQLSSYEINLLSRTPVKSVMDSTPHTIGPEETLEQAAQIMQECKVVCLPVVENSKVKGMICDNDVLRSFIGVMGIGQPGLRLSIRFRRQKGFLVNLIQLLDNNNAMIDKMVTFPQELVLKLQVEQPNKLREALEANGYQLLHFSEIPSLLASAIPAKINVARD
jgi:acetoin utilization protein AcuB